VANSSAARGHEVRQRLLAAAAELVPERGWAAVSTRILAERAGVTPSVVHYHFPSVSALLNEAVLGVMRQVLGGLDAVLVEARTPADVIDLMLTSADQYSGSDPLSLLSIEGLLAANRDEGLREQIAELVESFGRRFGAWLGEHGVAEPVETAAVLVAAIDGLLMRRGLVSDLDIRATRNVLRRLVE
jgi:AcrR family transcriptional regulator